ncbi:MAG: OmpA family protein [Proteobacteria bacterium]|nr:OmpA family protein [Candidatus Enterousia scatequi]
MKKYCVLLFSAVILAACQGTSCTHCQEPLSEPIYFEVGSDKIPHKSMANLTEITEFLSCHKFRRVHVNGYADEQGGKNSEHNKDLSYRRAQRVKDFLVAHGVTERYVTVSGNGTLPSGAKFENRRVDIILN